MYVCDCRPVDSVINLESDKVDGKNKKKGKAGALLRMFLDFFVFYLYVCMYACMYVMKECSRACSG